MSSRLRPAEPAHERPPDASGRACTTRWPRGAVPGARRRPSPGRVTNSERSPAPRASLGDVAIPRPAVRRTSWSIERLQSCVFRLPDDPTSPCQRDFGNRSRLHRAHLVQSQGTSRTRTPPRVTNSTRESSAGYARLCARPSHPHPCSDPAPGFHRLFWPRGSSARATSCAAARFDRKRASGPRGIADPATWRSAPTLPPGRAPAVLDSLDPTVFPPRAADRRRRQTAAVRDLGESHPRHVSLLEACRRRRWSGVVVALSEPLLRLQPSSVPRGWLRTRAPVRRLEGLHGPDRRLVLALPRSAGGDGCGARTSRRRA